MKIGIIGGRLQGTEAAYLAKKAGMRSVVVDRHAGAPAFGICDEAVILDAQVQTKELSQILAGCDCVLPANENLELLRMLPQLCERTGIPLLFDLAAYEVTCSKTRTNAFLSGSGIPIPRPWPACGLPAVVKPSEASGSKGVTRVDDLEQMPQAMARAGHPDSEVIVQEYVEGPSLSIEVLGNGAEAYPLVVTEIVLDERHDCKMVVSPSSTALAAQQELASIASECSRRLGLRGLMDVESILTPQGNRVLELDARIPSQTPSAVLHSHGVNILREMVRLAMDGNVHLPNASSQRCAVFGHVIQDSGFLRTTGEGGLRADRPMHLREGTFGADQLLTDATDWREEFACTYIISAPSASEVRFKLQRFFAQMEDASGLRLRDPGLVRP